MLFVEQLTYYYQYIYVRFLERFAIRLARRYSNYVDLQLIREINIQSLYWVQNRIMRDKENNLLLDDVQFYTRAARILNTHPILVDYHAHTLIT